MNDIYRGKEEEDDIQRWVMGLHEFKKPSSHITRQTASEFAAVEFKIKKKKHLYDEYKELMKVKM